MWGPLWLALVSVVCISCTREPQIVLPQVQSDVLLVVDSAMPRISIVESGALGFDGKWYPPSPTSESPWLPEFEAAFWARVKRTRSEEPGAESISRRPSPTNEVPKSPYRADRLTSVVASVDAGAPLEVVARLMAFLRQTGQERLFVEVGNGAMTGFLDLKVPMNIQSSPEFPATPLLLIRDEDGTLRVRIVRWRYLEEAAPGSSPFIREDVQLRNLGELSEFLLEEDRIVWVDGGPELSWGLCAQLVAEVRKTGLNCSFDAAHDHPGFLRQD